VSDHVRSLIVGYNPLHYRYHSPIPLNKVFKCWNQLWTIKLLGIGECSRLGLYAAEDIIVKWSKKENVKAKYLFPYSGLVYRRVDWDCIVHEWPHVAAYAIESNTRLETDYKQWEYIDRNPSYTWCISGYINSGVNFPGQVNVRWVECQEQEARLHKSAKPPHVWLIATKTVLARES
jgi:hypothetical protein